MVMMTEIVTSPRRFTKLSASSPRTSENFGFLRSYVLINEERVTTRPNLNHPASDGKSSA
jgi:hypothetical protein